MSNAKPPAGYHIVNRGPKDQPWWDIELDPDGSDPDDRSSVVRACHDHRNQIAMGAYARVARWHEAGCPVVGPSTTVSAYIRAGLPGWEG